MASGRETCKICDVQNILVVAEKWCLECEESICEKCFLYHCSSKSTKHHNTISIENYRELPQFILDIKQQCTEHNEIYQNYCLNHDVPLCKHCVVTTHKHCNDKTTIDAMIQNAKSSVTLNNIETRLIDVHLNVQNIIQDRKQNLHMLTKQEKDIQKEISDRRAAIKDSWDRLQQQIISQTNTIKGNLENVIENFETKDTKLKQTLDAISKIKLYASELQVFLGMKEIENQVQNEERFIDTMVVDGSLNKIDLHFKTNTKLETHLSDLGQILTEENPPTIQIVRRELKQAQHFRENNTDSKRKSNQENCGRQYWAQISYEAADEDELTIQQGDVLTVLDSSNTGWWSVSKYDSQNEILLEGLVPANYLIQDQLYLYEWFFGPASKEERDKLMLRNGKISGSFIVTETAEEGYSLSVLHRDKRVIEGVVYDYNIKRHNTSGYYLNTNETVFFDNVSNLIQYYSNTADGLCERLSEPIRVTIDESLEVAIASVRLDTLLHSGHFKDIYQGTLNNSVQVAVATVKPGPRTKIAAASEIYVLWQCRHDRIVRLYGISSTYNIIYIITELAGNGNLLNVLTSSEGQIWTLTHLIKIAAQIADGMSYLEKNKIIHKNLSAKHILLVDDNNIKITDFQLSIQDDYFLTVDGTIDAKWIAPEAVLLRKYTTKSDVWSFGIVLVELISHGEVPYPDSYRNEKSRAGVHVLV